MKERLEAIRSLVPKGAFYYLGEELIWENENPIPTDAQIADKMQELKAELLVIEKKEAFNNAIQTHLDNKAKEFRYDNIMSARSYAGYESAFQAEATSLAVWASACWVKAGEIEADVENSARDMPTEQEVLSELPTYE